MVGPEIIPVSFLYYRLGKCFRRYDILYDSALGMFDFSKKVLGRWHSYLRYKGFFQRLRIRVPPQVETYSFSKLWNFHNNIRSCVENESCCPRTVYISNVNFTSRISIPPEPVFKWWDNKCLALITQMVRALGMNPKAGGSSPAHN